MKPTALAVNPVDPRAPTRAGRGAWCLLLLGCVPLTALAQTISFAQKPPYLSTGVQPNLLVIYDNSQSMEAVMPGGNRTTFGDVNTRGNIARQVLRDSIATYQNSFRWGLATFDATAPYILDYSQFGYPPPMILYYSDQVSGAGSIRQPVQTTSAAHLTALNSLLANQTANAATTEVKNSTWATPLAGAIETAGKYFGNLFPATPTPITDKSCQRQFVVLATDGDPNYSKGAYRYRTDAELRNVKKADGTWTYSPATTEVIDEIQKLRATTVNNLAAVNGTYDVQTYIVGMGSAFENESSVAGMNRMAEVGGTGAAYLANDRASLTAAFAAINADITARTASSASVALNAGAWSNGSVAYLARFNSGDWSGQLQAYSLLASGATATTPLWDAAQRVKLQHWSTGRQILSYRPSSALGSRGVAFRWPANPASTTATEIPAAMVTALNRNGAGTADTAGAARLQYLRGDTSRELRNCPTCTGPTPFRNRPTTVLGDIINSTPLYLASGGRYVRDGAEASAYAAYRTARAAMTPMVYVGANDGMLHGFNANTGDEVFAYVPAIAADRLAALPEQGYGHHYSVDGPLVGGDVYYGGGWKTVLIGSLGAGGKGLYALDVSNPANFTEAQAQKVARWELDGSNATVGHILQAPLLTRTRDGKWRALVGNGYNSSNGVAVLMAIDVETGQSVNISTGAGSAATPNGLTGLVGLSSGNNGVVDLVYGTDQQGSLWKFDLSATDPSSWKVAYGTTAAPAPLFTTASGQPITARPDVTPHPEGGYLVTFGTGMYLASTDTSSTATQALYGIWDKGAPVTASQLVTQSVLGTTKGPDTRDYRFTTYAVGTPATVYTGDKAITSSLYLTEKRGWKLELPTAGERVVSHATVRYGKAIFSTMVPGTVNCQGGGDGWIMEVDAVTGNRSDLPALDTNADNQVDAADLLTWVAAKTSVSGVRLGAIPSAPSFIRAKDRKLDDKLVNTSDGTMVRVREAGGARPSGRAGWEQIQ